MICNNCKTEINAWTNLLSRWKGGRRICPNCGVTIYTESKHELLISNLISTMLLVLAFTVILAIAGAIVGPYIMAYSQNITRANFSTFRTAGVVLSCVGWGALLGGLIGLLSSSLRISRMPSERKHGTRISVILFIMISLLLSALVGTIIGGLFKLSAGYGALFGVILGSLFLLIWIFDQK